MSRAILLYFLEAQYVSGTTMPIFRSFCGLVWF